MIKTEIATAIDEFKAGLTEIDSAIKAGKAERAQETQRLDTLARDVSDLKRARIAGLGKPARKGEVSEDCARWLAAQWVTAAEVQGKLQGHPSREQLLSEASGIIRRSTLTTSDVPMPAEYGREVAEMVWRFGQARQYATVFPLGTGTAYLPRLKTSPAMGFIDAAATVTEKSPQVEHVAISAKKAGGLVRFPAEMAEDFVALGQFVARYFARELAKWEDTCLFTADGSSTYKLIKGVGKQAVDDSYVVTLASTKTHPSDIAIADCRALRAKVDGAALRNGAYYCHPSCEAMFAGFNTGGNTPYLANGMDGPRFDGFPIRWVGVMPVFDTGVHASQHQVYFGDLSFWYLCVMGTPSITPSRDVFFATDEIALRGLSRFDVAQLAAGCTAVLRTAAS